MKSLYFKCSFVVSLIFATAGSSFLFTQYITNCSTNSYGNTNCSYSDGSYEYYNQPGNKYYDRQGSYYHSDEYDQAQAYYEEQEEQRKIKEAEWEYKQYQKEQAEYEYKRYKEEQQRESRKPSDDDMYGRPSLEELYGPMDDSYTTSSNNSRNSYYTCPANSTLRNGECYCNDGYFVGSSGSCVQDMQYTCSQKYPGTIYRALDKACICPSGQPFGWNPTTRSCPKTTYTNPQKDTQKIIGSATKGLGVPFDWGAFVFFCIVVGVVVTILKSIGEDK